MQQTKKMFNVQQLKPDLTEKDIILEYSELLVNFYQNSTCLVFVYITYLINFKPVNFNLYYTVILYCMTQ